ncbi:MAG: hypothetical protein HY720_04240 [Planctomycetes bacterium]|nr:hypothetical protein [Planctomycetota bacterium]
MIAKRTIPLIICFALGLLMAGQYYVPTQRSTELKSDLAAWVQIIASFSLGLGLVSVSRMHYGRVRKMAPGWGYSIVAFVGLIGMLGVGLWWQGVDRTEDGALTPYGWAYQNVFRPLQATMFSVLAFYIVSAAFRAFRARSREATLLLVTGTIVMLGRAPVGDWAWDKVGRLGTGVSLSECVVWIMSVPNMSAQRGIGFGLTLGIIATSLKIIFGIERAYLGGGKD